MNGPLVTVGMPVYRGHDMIAAALQCVKSQTYRDLDVLISVDGPDGATAAACEPFLGDPRFRLHVQPSRLGWALNTDWTMRNRRGDFYIYQQHDDLVSPTYVADLVKAAQRWPTASICYSKMEISGSQNVTVRDPSLIGDPITRAIAHMERMNTSMLRGLIRGKGLDTTSGLPANEFEGFGSEHTFMVELALAGEFRFVDGPTYYKRLHGQNLHVKWHHWPEERKRAAWAYLAAGLVEVIVPMGCDPEDCWRLFFVVLERFLIARGFLSWLRNRSAGLHKNDFNPRAAPMRMLVDLARRGGHLDSWLAARSRYMFCQISNGDLKARAEILQIILDRLKKNGKLDVFGCLGANWQTVEDRAAQRFKVKP